jgi:hypothetical protein
MHTYNYLTKQIRNKIIEEYTMLLKIIHGNIFVTDTHIFINTFTASILREIPLLYAPLSIIDRRGGAKTIEILLTRLSSEKELTVLLKEKFYERLKRIREEGIDLDKAREIVKNIKIYPSIEYSFKGFNRELLVFLARNNYVWIIPFTDIKSIKKIKNILKIHYYSKLLNNDRVVRIKYDEQLYDLIKQLCLFNNNKRCR